MFGNSMEVIEIPTMIGIVTFVTHPNHNPPFRCYGPDGMEVDPTTVMSVKHKDHFDGCAAFDLSCFMPEERGLKN